VPGHSGAVTVPPEGVEIRAGGLRLRPWVAADADDVLRACSDPQVQRWTQVPVPYERSHAEDYAGRYVPEQWATGGELVWAVCDATNGRPLASLGLHAAHPEGVREVGFWCLPEARGRGVVADALQAVARWAFTELGLARLEWAAEVGNAASLRVAVKAGFVFEGRRRASLRQRDGSFRDGWWAARVPADGPDGAPPALPDPGPLRAGDLVLRRWRPEDTETLAAAIADDGRALPPGPAPTNSPEHARWFTSERSPQGWASGDGVSLAVLGPDGDVAGSLQLFRQGRRAGVGEVGVWVAPGWRRRGTATAAVSAMLDWAVPTLGLARAEWHADDGNAASVALAARLGFEREGRARSALPAGDRGDPRLDAVVLARTWP
jgi:RimJ/RimL family protein N-acetyltransferase